MSNQDLPVKTSDDFLAESESMDLSELRDKTFLVAVSTGDRSGPKSLSTTIHGPYNFLEMVEEVGVMWQEHQHHAKVIIADRNRNNAIKTLDENTCDYIECHFSDIVTEEMLKGAFDEDKDFTCRAGIVEADSESDPRHAAKDMKPAKEPEDDL